MKLSLGPVQYYWSAKQIFDFYDEVANWPVDIVYLGENVCSKRRAVRLQDWLTIAQQLQTAGKEVILSTMVLIEAASELKILQRICGNASYSVEANDMAAIELLSDSRSFVVGPQINSYNHMSLNLFSSLGAKRWVLPFELSKNVLADMQSLKPKDLETEVVVYGRLPLAYSARCFTARAHNLPKDQCQYRCEGDSQGIPLSTQDNNSLFTLNGIQVQSSNPCNLIDQIDQLANLNVDVLRIYPLPNATQYVVKVFSDILNKLISTTQAISELGKQQPDTGWCNGYWHGNAGMRWIA